MYALCLVWNEVEGDSLCTEVTVVPPMLKYAQCGCLAVIGMNMCTYVPNLHSLKCDLKCAFWEIPEHIHMLGHTYICQRCQTLTSLSKTCATYVSPGSLL